MAIAGVWYRRGYIVPIPDEYNNDPGTIVGYVVRCIASTSLRFLPTHKLFPDAPEKTEQTQRNWFLTEQDARDAIDQAMTINGWPDV